ncbi:MAG TPA: hypothetical protein VM600_08920, partial [Actinomycetota bacterium]|nr:hypothetical protein [Actinomycetota bacterium]
VLGFAPAGAAAPECVMAGAATGEDGTIGLSCTFTADTNPHGYAAAIPNDWDIFLDVDGDGKFEALDGDVLVQEFSPSEASPPAGQLPLATGKMYTVRIYNGCAGACGHIGALYVR